MSKSIMEEFNYIFHSRGGVSFVSTVNNTKLNTLFQDKNMCTKYIKIEIEINSKITRHVAINKTMGATSGAQTAYLEVHLGSTPVFSGVVVHDLVCVYFVDRRLSVCPHDWCHVWRRSCYHPGAPEFTHGVYCGSCCFVCSFLCNIW